MDRTRLRSLVVLVALVVSSLPGVVPSVAASDANSEAAAQHAACTVGDARAVLEAIALVPGVMLPRGQNHPGLLEASVRCQYRLWHNGETFTACEDDVIVGGIVYFWPYKADGVSRPFAVADTELFNDRAWLNGQEQVLHRTAYKNVETPLGTAVWQQRAFITQLPPGDYASVWVSTYDGVLNDTATVNVHILPREQCS
jgi:hypothetical protein